MPKTIQRRGQHSQGCKPSEKTQRTEPDFAKQNNEGTSCYIKNLWGTLKHSGIVLISRTWMDANWCVTRYFWQKHKRHLAWLWKHNKFNKCSIYCMSNMANYIYSSLFKLKITETEWKPPAFLSSMVQHVKDVWISLPSSSSVIKTSPSR